MVRDVAIPDDGQVAVSASDDATLKVWKVDSGQAILTLGGPQKSVHAVDITPDGRLVASGADDKTLKICELQDCNEGSPIGQGGERSFRPTFRNSNS
jgi:WD40 repeat protein